MQLLRNVGDDRVETERWRFNSGEIEKIVRHHHIRLAHKWIVERNVHAERATIDRAREPAFNTIPVALELHSFGSKLGMIRVRLDLEEHVVAEVEAPRSLQALEDIIGGARHPQIDVLGGAGLGEPQFENQPTLEDYGIARDSCDPREEAVEDKELAAAREVNAG